MPFSFLLVSVRAAISIFRRSSFLKTSVRFVLIPCTFHVPILSSLFRYHCRLPLPESRFRGIFAGFLASGFFSSAGELALRLDPLLAGPEFSVRVYSLSRAIPFQGAGNPPFTLSRSLYNARCTSYTQWSRRGRGSRICRCVFFDCEHFPEFYWVHGFGNRSPSEAPIRPFDHPNKTNIYYFNK